MGELTEFPTSDTLVDAQTLADHLKLHVTFVRKMAKARKFPALIIKNGSREYYRFRISEVEQALRGDHEDTPRIVSARPDSSSKARQRA